MSEYESAEDIKARMAEEAKAPEPDNNPTEDLDDKELEEEKEAPKQLSLADRLDNAYKGLDDTEKEAWSQGWRPKEFFKGKNRDGSQREFTEAEDFLNKSKDALPVANDRIREITKELEETKRIAKEAQERVLKAEQKGYEKALDELSKKQREAVELGDIEEFDRLKEQERNIAKESIPQQVEKKEVVADVVTNTPKQQPQDNQLSEGERITLRDWQARNQWMSTDQKLAAYAIQSEKQLIQERPYLSLSERLQLVEQEVKDVFHAKFNPTNSSNNMFEGGGSNTGFGSSVKPRGYSELTSEDKKACENLINIRGIKDANAVKAFRQNFAKAVNNN